jgi:hypothetical protein
MLPWWACSIGKPALPWSARAVLSIVMAKLASLKRAIEDGDGINFAQEIGDRKENEIVEQDLDGDDPFVHLAVKNRIANEFEEEIIGHIDNLGGDERFRFSVDWLTACTGLSRDSVIAAKQILNHRHGILNHYGDHRRQKRVSTPTDMLVPNWDFRCITKSVSEDKCTIVFSKKRGGSKNGQ